MTFYKYCRPDHAQQMLARGSLSVGTFQSYRGTEASDPRADPEEGMIIATAGPGPTPLIVQAGDPFERYFRAKTGFALNNVELQSCGLGGHAVVLPTACPDAFVYCVSAARSRALAHK